MFDLPDILPHLVHADAVQGGALLFGGDRVAPVLGVEEFVDARRRGVPRLTPEVKVRRSRGRERRTASSAEAVRALKASMGVPARPTNDPVDVWSRN